MTHEHKDWINHATYAQLLRIWRGHEGRGHVLLQDDTGEYFYSTLKRRGEDTANKPEIDKQTPWRK